MRREMSKNISVLFSVRVNKKYTVEQLSDGRLIVLRYGKEWRNCTGDNLVLAMAQRIYDLEMKK